MTQQQYSPADLTRGTKYGIIHQSAGQKYPRRSVMTYLGASALAPHGEGEWNARPAAGTQTLPWSQVQSVYEIPAAVPHVVGEDARMPSRPVWASTVRVEPGAGLVAAVLAAYRDWYRARAEAHRAEGLYLQLAGRLDKAQGFAFAARAEAWTARQVEEAARTS